VIEGGGGTTPSGGEAAGAEKFSSGGTTTSGGSKFGGQVYMGQQYQAPGGYGPHGGSGSVAPDKGASVLFSKQQAYQFMNGLSGKQLSDLQAKMQYAGLIKDDDGIMEMQAKWKKLVDASAGLTAAGRKISPMDILDSYLGKGPLGGKGGLGAGGASGAALWQTQYRGGRKFLVNSQTGEVKYEGPRFETTYNKSIDLTDPTTAKAIATSVFQQLLHRDPGNGEMGGFAGALRTAEQQSPVVTNTTTEYDMNTGEAIGQSSESSGGMSADAKQYLGIQQVKKKKEYGAVQAATTYENALESAIFNNPFGSI
jgi:hypothetical protein